MEKFFVDKRSEDDVKKYIGMDMASITEAEEARFDAIRPTIDEAHAEFAPNRGHMLTVGKLVAWLKEQDQNACVLAFEPNSNAYIEQFPDLPSPDICTVAQSKKKLRESLKHWYRDTANAEEKIARELEARYRYAKDNDVIIEFC